jgi:hypothetical protein
MAGMVTPYHHAIVVVLLGDVEIKIIRQFNLELELQVQDG